MDKKRLKKRAWKLYSQVRRLEESHDGYVQCVSCGGTYWWRDVDAGHFEGGRYNSLLFVDSNCHPQCRSCNRGGAAGGGARGVGSSGGEAGYALFMLERYGRDEMERIKRLRAESVQFSVDDYQDMIADFKRRLAKYDHLKPEGGWG